MTTLRWMPHEAVRLPAPARHDDMGHHVAWYVAAGAVTTGLQAVLFLAGRPLFGSTAANLVSVALTTLANTEFHRLVTFAGTPSHPLRRHLQSVATFAFYAGYGTLGLLALDAVVPTPSATLEATVLATASVLGGILRFVALKWWVFARRH